MNHPFRSLELSDPTYGMKNLQFITIKSKNLKGRGDICVYVPENCPPNASVVILLHGVYGSAWSWPFSSGVHELVDRAIQDQVLKPMILVMPSDGLWGDGSGYVSHKNQNFEKWIIEDVVQAVKSVFEEQIGADSKFFITGLSMGGYGAMRIGSRHPHIFTAFSGLSSITTIEEFELFVEEKLNEYQTDTDLSLIDCLSNKKLNLIPFRFDCGKDDLLIAYNRRLHQQLLEANITHEYYEYEGGHDWEYWRNNIMKTILFFNLLA